LKAAQAVGIPDERVVLDPGFGFGKMGVENYALLAGLAELKALDRPVLCGISRKGFLARTIERFYGDAGELPPMEARGVVTQAANVASVLGGAHLLRVHDVRAAQEAVAVADMILAAG
jgi:dihydropteroate synthase